MVWSASVPQRRTTNFVRSAPETKPAKPVTDQQEFSHGSLVIDSGFTNRVLAGRRVAQGEVVTRSIVAAGGDAAFQLCDVTEPESVEEAATRSAVWGGLIFCPTTQAARATRTDQ